jgi:hypothetical protein
MMFLRFSRKWSLLSGGGDGGRWRRGERKSVVVM